MRTFLQASALTASGDTTETLIDTQTLSSRAKRIVGLWAYGCAAATMTSGEVSSGIVRFDSPDFTMSPCQIPLSIFNILTSGAAALEVRIIPVNIPCVGSSRVSAYVTMDMAQTGGVKARFGVIYEGDE